MKLIAGNSNLPLAIAVATALKTPLSAAHIQRFPDQEIFVDIQEGVRGDDVYVIQSTSHPTNDHLMELLIIMDALKRGSARRITAVIPYFGYARQDRKSAPRTAISAKLVANLLVTAGAQRIMTFDLHAAQIQGFFDIPLDHLYASPLFAADIQDRHAEFLLVSPDIGGVVRTRELADRLDAPLAIVEKRRQGPGHVDVQNIIGNVRDKYCLLIDDIVDSGGTLCKAATALMDAGARGVSAYATHGVLSGAALEQIMASPLEALTLTDTINVHDKLEACPKIRLLTLARLLAEAIHRVSNDKSVSGLFC